MKAVVWTKFGPPDVLQVQEVAKPVPADNEVLVKIYATTVSAADSQIRGLRFPIVANLLVRIYFGRIKPKPVILGQELAGEIEKVGKDVTRFKRGDQVFAWSGFGLGTYAEYKCIPESGVITTKPPSMTCEEAATLPVGGLEATYFIRKANIQAGEKVLIYGAGGSIGTYALQLAAYFGADVTAVDSAAKQSFLLSFGANHVMDYKRQDFTRNGTTYDVIFDVIGKTNFARCMRSLSPNGRYLIGNPRLWQRIGALRAAGKSSKQVFPWASRTTSESRNDLDFLKELIVAGKIRPAIDRTFPLEQTAEAHRYVDKGEKKGNVVITVAHETATPVRDTPDNTLISVPV